MGRRFKCLARLLVFAVSVSYCFSAFAGQDSPASNSPAPPQTTGSAPAASGPDSPAGPKKTKKVWTNENLTEVSSSPITQIGEVKNGSSAKSAAAKPPASVVASFRKQLAALQAQVTFIDKQIADLNSFTKGEVQGANGLELHKRYSTEPIPNQMQKLEEKRKMLAVQMDAVFDAARKRGIEPGQLE